MPGALGKRNISAAQIVRNPLLRKLPERYGVSTPISLKKVRSQHVIDFGEMVPWKCQGWIIRGSLVLRISSKETALLIRLNQAQARSALATGSDPSLLQQVAKHESLLRISPLLRDDMHRNQIPLATFVEIRTLRNLFCQPLGLELALLLAEAILNQA